MSKVEAVSGRRLPPDDAKLFRAAMRDVKPLRARRARPAPQPEPPTARPGKKEAERISAKPATSVNRNALPVVPAKPNPGIDRGTAERLRKGEMAIERRLDLHGMTQDDAHAALDRFVRKAWGDGKRMLLVITGKGSVSAGGGVLRRHVPRWLAAGEHGPRVLRIETAQPRHGGSGALYVLLRRQRGER
jgi:DNA-nicking Smr family endonuclease